MGAGRRPGPTTTPDEILDAARALFAERGFPGTSVRAVAAQAGVNAALVHHYFGTKEDLFVASLRLPLNPAATIVEVLDDGPRTEFASRLARRVVQAWRDPTTGLALQAVLRRALADEQSALALRNLVDGVLLRRVADAVGVSPRRIAAAMTHLIGTMIGASVIGISPLAEASEDELVALVTPAIAGYVDP